jgi:hypothetical protein
VDEDGNATILPVFGLTVADQLVVPGKVTEAEESHVIPSSEYRRLSGPNIKNRPVTGLTTIDVQLYAYGRDIAAQVEPLSEYAAALLSDMITNRPVTGLTVILTQFDENGKVEAVHVVPLSEYAALLLLYAIATYRPVL